LLLLLKRFFEHKPKLMFQMIPQFISNSSAQRLIPLIFFVLVGIIAKVRPDHAAAQRDRKRLSLRGGHEVRVAQHLVHAWWMRRWMRRGGHPFQEEIQ
jgi:hypothetical protein